MRWELKEQTRELRRQGLSYKDILQYIPVAKSTISLWCRDIELTLQQRLALGKRYDTQHRGAKANQRKRQEEISRIKEAAFKEITKPSRSALMMAGAMLYWAEGNKSHSLGITNSDSNLIRFMVWWFQNFLGIPISAMKARLNVHSGQNEEKIKKFWSRETAIPLTQFGKTYIKPEGVGFRKNVLYNGTIRVEIFNKNLLHQVLAWIEKYQEYLRKKGC